MTEQEAGIRARHWRVGGRGTVYPEQCVCGLAWPCDAAFLLAEVDRLRGVVAAARKLTGLIEQRERRIVADTWETDAGMRLAERIARAEQSLGNALGVTE